MTVLVAGATGVLGTEICQLLRARGDGVRALVRRTSEPVKIEHLREIGAQVSYGNLNAMDSLENACRRATHVISTATAVSSRMGDTIPEIDEHGQLQLVDAAEEAGVMHFIYISFSGNLRTDSPLHHAKRAVEERLRRSSMEYTILRPSCFMESWLGPATGFNYREGEVTIYGEGEAPISYIALGDVAQFAVHAIDIPAAVDSTLELGGPEALSPLEAVKIFEAVAGKPFTVQKIPEAVLQEQYENATDPLARSFSALMLDVAHGDQIDSQATADLFHVRLTPVREYAQHALGMVMA